MLKAFSLLIVLVTSLIALPRFCVANDSAIAGTSGRPGALKAHALLGEHSSIRMVSETVDIQIEQSDYVTDARFVFHNDGLAQTVRMGFPEGARGDSDLAALKRATSFKSFATWVDDRRVHATRMFDARGEDDFSFDAYWVKSVRFARGQTRCVRVLYRSPLGSSTSTRFVSYDFTGGNWKGKVQHSILNITFKTPGIYRIQRKLYNSKATSRKLPSGYRFYWSDWQAQEDFIFRFARTIPNKVMQAFGRGDLTKKSDLYSDWDILKISGTNQFDSWRITSEWPPTGVLYEGKIFMAFREFNDALRIAWEKKAAQQKRSVKPNAGIYSRGGFYIMPSYGHGNGNIRVETDSQWAQVGGKKVDLGARTVVSDGVLYVPLAPLVHAMGGQIEFNKRAMRFWYEWPV